MTSLESGESSVPVSLNSLRSAEVVVPLVVGYVKPQSVLDLGCKHGEWLSVFRRHGAQTLLGFDRKRYQLLIRPEEMRVADLNQRLQMDQRFDLAVCVEVAEHLLPSSAAPLIETLTATAPVILFSAALPKQGGHGHFNEQPRAYWHRLFAERGFVPVDCLRPQIWQDRRIAYWYRQNLLFYVSSERIANYPSLLAECRKDLATDLELVHEDILKQLSITGRLRALVSRTLRRLSG